MNFENGLNTMYYGFVLHFIYNKMKGMLVCTMV